MQDGKLKVRYPVIVEGKYDKIALSSVIDTPIVCTGGYAVFNRSQLRSLLLKMAQASPLILLTDSDGGGRQIRSYLTGFLPPERLIQLYIPQIPGKERRKRTAGKAGLLGVEGMDATLLRSLFTPFSGGNCPARPEKTVSKTDFFADGLSGKDGSADLRRRLAISLGLPGDLTANALLEAINLIHGYDGYRRALDALRTNE